MKFTNCNFIEYILHSCFISEIGVFFGAFLVPIILIILFNACIFIVSSFVVIRLKVTKSSQMQQKFSMSSKDTCKLLATLAGFMFLLGLSWIILLFTVVGADTNIYAAFAIQWLFVFFNSLQGFFLFVFFVALNQETRNLWFNFLFPCLKSKKGGYSTRFKSYANAKLSHQRSDTLKPLAVNSSETLTLGILSVIISSTCFRHDGLIQYARKTHFHAFSII